MTTSSSSIVFTKPEQFTSRSRRHTEAKKMCDYYDEDEKIVKCKEWNFWLDSPLGERIASCNNEWNIIRFGTPLFAIELESMNPREAATTEQGKKFLKFLLDDFERTENWDRLYPSKITKIPTFTIPSMYARWKLGLVEGNAEQFAEEEAILNFKSDNRPTIREERHEQRFKKKTTAIWIPKRCEVVGCDKKGDDAGLRCCAACSCVWYCGKEHQSQDWKRHKVDCRTLEKMSSMLHPKPFCSSKELKKYPLGCFPITGAFDSKEKKKKKKRKCFVCHSTKKEAEIAYTKCCNLPICDNFHDNKHGSSKEVGFCYLNHKFFSPCWTHHKKGHEGDWRVCVDCNELYCGTTRSFRTTNRFSATPCLEHFIPQGSMITHPCGFPACERRFIPHLTGTSEPNETPRCFIPRASTLADQLLV